MIGRLVSIDGQRGRNRLSRWIKGSGNLIVQGGTLEISGANADFHASTSIKPDAAVEINSVLGLGDNEVQDNVH